MRKPKFLYHGSGKKLVGEMLVPKQAKDMADVEDNSFNGVYASDWKKWAIIMGVLGCKGVRGASTHITGKRMIDAIIINGYPNQEYFYLHTLSSESFENKPTGSFQWVSVSPVKPIKTERLKVEDYVHLVRLATKEEKDEWFNSYGGKIKK